MSAFDCCVGCFAPSRCGQCRVEDPRWDDGYLSVMVYRGQRLVLKRKPSGEFPYRIELNGEPLCAFEMTVEAQEMFRAYEAALVAGTWPELKEGVRSVIPRL